jgi:hypothetical protein
MTYHSYSRPITAYQNLSQLINFITVYKGLFQLINAYHRYSRPITDYQDLSQLTKAFHSSTMPITDIQDLSQLAKTYHVLPRPFTANQCQEFKTYHSLSQPITAHQDLSQHFKASRHITANQVLNITANPSLFIFQHYYIMKQSPCLEVEDKICGIT